MGTLLWIRSFQTFRFLFVAGTVALILGYLAFNDKPRILENSLQLEAYARDALVSQDGYTSMEQEQFRRKHLLMDFCRRRSSLSSVPLNTAVFIVNENHKIIYCRAGKTGSSTTAAVLYNLEHGYNMTVRQVNKEKNSLPFKLLSRRFYTEDEISTRLSTYYSLLVVRNPLERLASAWMDKFVRNSPLGYNDRYQSMLKTVALENSRPKSNNIGDISDEPTTKKTRQVPFLAFLRAAADNKEEWMDGHWLPISDVCAPCKVHFNYIAHTETLAEDLRLFLKKVGVTDRDDVLPEAQETRADQSLMDLYRVVSLEDLRKVRRKFQADYDMFGYSYKEDVLRLSRS